MTSRDRSRSPRERRDRHLHRSYREDRHRSHASHSDRRSGESRTSHSDRRSGERDRYGDTRRDMRRGDRQDGDRQYRDRQYRDTRRETRDIRDTRDRETQETRPGRVLPTSIAQLDANADADASDDEDTKARKRRQTDARAQALTLEILGDLPYAEVKPPENVLFVCKLNPVTDDEDLRTFFSQCGPILACDIVRDKKTNNSLQYAFIEYENKADCEKAYARMQGALIDDSRIHVDFSQSVSRLQSSWRANTNRKRALEATKRL
ncbi:hypothetical protein V1512DRAFT_259781 [Lipomyces arxii]|uniref:uncharacterized protein n=1 Tax=Lipomyces arxii TaxID=56418 RepID=UPI0034CF2448